MPVKVVGNDKYGDVPRRALCGNCASTLEYDPYSGDVYTTTTDHSGVMTTWIKCPLCDVSTQLYVTRE